MDPAEVALMNDGVEGKDMEQLAEFKRAHGFPDRDSLRECIDAGKNAIGWDGKWHAPGASKLPNGRMHGMGFIWSQEWDDTRGAGSAGLMIQADGTVNIIALRSDIGLNAETAYCQIVAEELGMRAEDVFFRQQDDVYLPLMTPDGSCNLTTNGYVMKKIAKLAKQKLLELATTSSHLIERDIPAGFPGPEARRSGRQRKLCLRQGRSVEPKKREGCGEGSEGKRYPAAGICSHSKHVP